MSGILGAGLGLLAGFIVIDAIANTVKCTNGNCGQTMHASKQAEHLRTHHQKQPGGSMDDILGFGEGGVGDVGLGVNFPDLG